MRRRILLATLGVTAAALVAFGVPLGWSVSRIYRSQQLTRLQQAATIAAAAVPPEGLRGPDPVEVPAGPAATHLGYYDARGALAAGTGTPTPDAPTRHALGGHPSEGEAHGRLVVAVPIIANETSAGAVEASAPRSIVTARTARAWLVMALLGILALGAAAVIAVLQARRLTRPIDQLVTIASRLGGGDFDLEAPTSGIAELDRAAGAIQTSGALLGRMVSRERAFSANASHQLRTPLTALRLDLENALQTPGVDPASAVADAIEQIDRFEETLEQLLTLARTGEATGRRIPLTDVLGRLEQRWHPILATKGRQLRVLATEGPTAQRDAPSCLVQILDVLLDNATIHGDGTVEVVAVADGRWVSVDVADEGAGLTALPEPSWQTPDAQHDRHGLGLPLAQSLAQGAGGTLLLRQRGPHPVIGVLLP